MQYKIGNKANGIIRSYCAGQVGNLTAMYDNQPLCHFKDVIVNVDFLSTDKDATSRNRVSELVFNKNQINSVTIEGIPMTDKILALIFKQNECNLCNTDKDYMSDENGDIFLDLPGDAIYQVFVFDENGQLEVAYGEYTETILHVSKTNSPYLIFYSYLGNKSFLLSKPDNYYVKLDLELIGNKEDDTIPMFMHFDKCGISPDNRMRLGDSLNTIDLTFTIINTEQDYITIQ